jgi:hypothetical protein
VKHDRKKRKGRVLLAAVSAFAVMLAVFVAGTGVASAHDAQVQVCKAADNTNGTVSGSFSFTISGTRDGVPVTDPFTIAVGPCAGSNYDGWINVVITELAAPGTSLQDVSVDPPANLVSTDLANRTVTISTIDFANVTATFTNINTPPPPPAGCSLTWGFYKNHSSVVTTIVTNNGGLLVGASTLNATQVNALLAINEQGPNYLIKLVHQLIAAELNGAGGASVPASVQSAINAANALIAHQGGPNGSATSQTTVSYGGTTYTASGLNNTLDAYNNGNAAGGPLHCRS